MYGSEEDISQSCSSLTQHQACSRLPTALPQALTSVFQAVFPAPRSATSFIYSFLYPTCLSYQAIRLGSPFHWCGPLNHQFNPNTQLYFISDVLPIPEQFNIHSLIQHEVMGNYCIPSLALSPWGTKVTTTALQCEPIMATAGTRAVKRKQKVRMPKGRGGQHGHLSPKWTEVGLRRRVTTLRWDFAVWAPCSACTATPFGGTVRSHS